MKDSSNDEKSAEQGKSSRPIVGNDAEQVSCSTVGTANKTQHHSQADAEDEDEAHPKELATVQKRGIRSPDKAAAETCFGTTKGQNSFQ